MINNYTDNTIKKHQKHIKQMKYYYTACTALQKNVNEDYRHYYRLYKDNGVKPILVEQGLETMITGWESKYDAKFNPVNPYPDLD